MSKKCSFNPKWCDPSYFPTYAAWVEEVPGNASTAHCKFCHADISLSNMGVQALISHESGRKHSQRVPTHLSTKISNFFGKRQHSVSPSLPVIQPGLSSNESVRTIQLEPELTVSQELEGSDVQVLESASTSVLTPLPSQPAYMLSDSSASSSRHITPLHRMRIRNEVTRAEVLWCLYTVDSHSSTRAAEKGVAVAKLAFPDSEIAKEMQLHKDKIAYTVSFGLKEYFQNELLEIVLKCTQIVISFDESLNKISQHEQMDIHVHYWDSDKNIVVVRYLNSCFLGHTTASDLLTSFKAALCGVKLCNILQVSMDGPNVNLKFLRDLRDDICSSPTDPVFLDIGTCGLHVIHNAFKCGHKSTQWEIMKFLRAIYNFFKDVPARREDYTKYSGSSLFPKRVCSVRWVENQSIGQRALDILPHIKAYVDGMTADKTIKSLPSSTSFEVICEALHDPFLRAKLAFFVMTAGLLEPFLTQFQSNKPLLPFLYNSLSSLLRDFMKRFVKPAVLQEADTGVKLCKIDVTSKSGNLLNAKDVDIGFATKHAIGKIHKEMSDKQILQFRSDCLKFYISLTEKIITKSPLTFKLVRGASCLNPTVVCSKNKERRIADALDVLVEHNWISGCKAEKVKSVYVDICKLPDVLEAMKNFDQSSDRLDELWCSVLKTSDAIQHLKPFVETILILSHGNAGVERGFSVNKECLVENLHEDSLVAQRIVYDAIQASGGLQCITVTTRMLQYARNSNQKWREALKKKKEEATSKLSKAQERKLASREVLKLEEMKRKLRLEAEDKIEEINVNIEKLKKKVKS